MKAICAACDDKFVPHFATTMMSVAISNPGVKTYLVSDGISPENLAKLSAFSSRIAVDLEIIDASQLDLSGLKTRKNYSRAVWIRVFLPQLLPASLETVLHLDADVLVLKDVAPLFEFEMGAHPIAAVPEDDTPRTRERKATLGIDEADPYINPGVMLMNLSAWRERELSTRVRDYALANAEKLFLLDMCAINAVMAHEAAILERTYNFFPHVHSSDRIDPRIVHYAGPKPWNKRHVACGYLYHHFRAMTPWPEKPVSFSLADFRETARYHIKNWRRSLLNQLGAKKYAHSAQNYRNARINNSRLRRLIH